MDHTIFSQSQVTQVLLVWVDIYGSEFHDKQHEGVVNVSLNCFVRIKLWLIVKTFPKFSCAYLQQGFFCSLDLHSYPSPLLPQADS